MKVELKINGRVVGPGHPVYIVAELSANHGQDFDQAVRIVRAMKGAGADAVKVQTYTPDTLTIQSDLEYFQIRGGTLWDGRTLYDLLRGSFHALGMAAEVESAGERTRAGVLFHTV